MLTIYKEFINGYVTAMLWASSGEYQGEELESLEGFDLALETEKDIEEDCKAFINENLALLVLYINGVDCGNNEGYEIAGHDYFLTRCGHGVGFWCRGLGDIGDRLTDAAHKAGEVWPYIGDDGLVYL